MRDFKTLIPIVLSVAAIGVSLLTVWVTYFTPAELSVVTGEYVHINHWKDGQLGVSIPISIINDGARLATVQRVGLVIRRRGHDEVYLLQPHSFQRINEAGRFTYESLPFPIPVEDRSTEVRQVLFASSEQRPEEFQLLNPGTYELTVLVWVKGTQGPKAKDRFSIELSKREAGTLQKWLSEENSDSLSVQQSKWKNWKPHRLTELEVRTLLQ